MQERLARQCSKPWLVVSLLDLTRRARHFRSDILAAIGRRQPNFSGAQEEDSAMRCLNLGCGSRFHPTWTNLDAISSNAAVRACDLNKGIPFPDNSFQVVYHSHVLEHFPKDKAFELMQECRRVLETGGVIRVAVPDLEQIVRMY
jgi:ubiquinone/menaquinone biosynthesis C-methylase UbiE